MISITRFNEFLMELQAEVNALLSDYSFVLKDGMWVYQEGDGEDDIDTGLTTPGKLIDVLIVSPTEGHLVKKLKDATGIVLAVQLAPTDTQIDTVDNYSENNNELFFVMEKIDPGRLTDLNEQYHYAKLQLVMKLVKEYIISRGLNGNMCGGDETLVKPFHTEWEYQAFGGFNGLSVGFDLKDWRL